METDILAATCGVGACHAGDDPAAGLDLASGDPAAALSGVPATYCADKILLVPGRPDRSYLVEKLTGPECGEQMPRDGDPLSEAEIDCVRAWIAEMN